MVCLDLLEATPFFIEESRIAKIVKKSRIA